ncbi:DUF4232 domain-containing protein [Streptomyces sp. CBMA152]|uniref:DUF4232 domain-containing protein n=1 Tax=Streptomyces sp. CBMA152 TaxID=1896312 RepID=UPI0016617591|nr:DUF4232 domain-containing protein [Streptomyces sp. CBMA152]MBD0745764.1 hypothetical protein [Streptomyces sp. CBMA152]
MRTNFRITAAATTTLIAALALTACGSDGGSKASEKPTPSASVSAPATGGTETGTDGGSGGTGGHTTAKPAKSKPETKKPGSGGTGSSKPVTCTGSNVKLTATVVSRPINHVLLTATNIGKTSCYAYDAPAVGFSNAQSPIPVDPETQPQAVVTLAPGQSAYAMVRTQGAGSDPYKTSQVVVYFRGAVGMESVGRSAYATLSKPVGVIDAEAMATYWQSTLTPIQSW